MADRRPLALVSGVPAVIPSGDTVPLAAGGTGATTASSARTALGLGSIATQAAGAVAITGGTVAGITDLAIADGGTGASTAAAARTALGLTTAPSPTVVASLSSGWVAFGSGFAPPAYYKAYDGLVTIEGLIKSGVDGVLFTLPGGYRPANSLIYVGYKNNGFYSVTVSSTGDVNLYMSGADFSSLSGISFYAG